MSIDSFKVRFSLRHLLRNDNFLENLEGIKFIAVHYRFDKDDWMKHCSESTAVNPACEKVIDILNDIPKDRVQWSFDPN